MITNLFRLPIFFVLGLLFTLMPTFTYAALEDCPGNLLGCYVPPISTPCTPVLNAFTYENGIPVLNPSPTIQYGESVLLYWSGGIFSVNDTKSIINYGPVGPSYFGSVVVTPTQTTTYTMRCDWSRTSYLGTTGGTAYSSPRTVTVINSAPNTPTISGPSSGQTGQSLSFTFTATDPDSNNLRYRIDWDNNGSVDQNTGYVASGVSQSRSRTWSTPGTYTFRVRAQDTPAGAQSGWRSKTVTISSPPPPASQCSDGIDNDGDGFVDSNDYGCFVGGTYNPSKDSESPNPQCSDGIDNNGNGKIDYPDDPACTSPTDNNEEALAEAEISLEADPAIAPEGAFTSLNWVAANVEEDSCTLSGTNGDSWNLSGTSGTQNTSNLTQETIYTLSCTDLNGDPVATGITVKLLPSFEEI